MKKIIICAMLLIIATATFSQQSKSSPFLTKQDYLRKSKHQKIAAWVLLPVGTAMILTGTYSVIASPYFDLPTTPGIIIIGMGAASVLGSIQLFHASRENKKKGMSLSFKNETIQQLQKSSFVYRPVPSLVLKIRL